MKESRRNGRRKESIAMGLYEFNLLSEHDKYDLVFTKGQFVDTVTERNEIRLILIGTLLDRNRIQFGQEHD